GCEVLKIASCCEFLYERRGHHLEQRSFPTRRSSDLRTVNSVSPRSWAMALVELNAAAARAEMETVSSARATPRPRSARPAPWPRDRKSTRLNSSHVSTSYAVFCL